MQKKYLPMNLQYFSMRYVIITHLFVNISGTLGFNDGTIVTKSPGVWDYKSQKIQV